MRGVLADTGPLYAAYDSSDRYHDRAQQELIVFSQQPLPVIVLYPVRISINTDRFTSQTIALPTVTKAIVPALVMP